MLNGYGTAFEVACVVVIAVTLLVEARRTAPARLVASYAALALAGWIGEATAIAWYGYYGYAEGWHLRLAGVPLLVPLIWPLVILSAIQVVDALWPALGRARPLAVAAVVAFDASLVEVIASAVGLWAWNDPRIDGVPLAGVVGWSWFALGAAWALGRAGDERAGDERAGDERAGDERAGDERADNGRAGSGRSWWRGPLLVIPAGLASAHVLIVSTWWAFFKWVPVGMASAGLGLVVLAAVAGTVLALRTRGRGLGMGPGVAGPRILAAGLFGVLLPVAPFAPSLWIHALAVTVPYVTATRLR